MRAPRRDVQRAARRRDARGAVYVEFLIVFLPFATAFFGALQLGYLGVATLVTKHAATRATRAAIVVLPDDPAFYDGAPVGMAAGTKRGADITAAAAAPLTVFSDAPRVTTNLVSPRNPGDLVTVEVAFDFECRVPIGSLVFCSEHDGRRWFEVKAAATLPNQGATFAYGDH